MIRSGAGSDLVNGGAGDDTLILGGGVDLVTFEVGGGNDEVFGFNRKKHLLDLTDFFETGERVEDFVADHARQTGRHVEFSFDDGSSLLVRKAKIDFFTEDTMVDLDDVVSFTVDDGVSIT